MAKINVDAKEAVANVKELNKELDNTQREMQDVNDASIDMGQAFANMTNNTDDMTKGMDAADKVLSAMGVNLGGVKKAMEAVKGVVPALRTGLKGVEGGFKGVAKAIVATGIGALVVSIALLASNWEKVTHWVKEFRKNINDTLPGLAKTIDFVSNAINSIVDWVKKIGENLGQSKIGKWLGLDKFAEKMRNIKVAVKAANDSTREWANETEKSVEKVGKAAEKAEEKLQRVLIDWDKVTSNSKKRKEAAAARRGEDFKIGDIDLNALADTLDAELEAMSDFATEQMNLDNKVAENFIANEKRKQDASEQTNAVVGGLSSVLAATMATMDSNSKTYKTLATIQIIASTLAGAMSVFAAPDNITMAQKIASYAGVIATGAGSIASLNANKLTSQASVPQLSSGLPTSMAAANAANAANAIGDSQVYITERQLNDNAKKQAKIKEQTTF